MYTDDLPNPTHTENYSYDVTRTENERFYGISINKTDLSTHLNILVMACNNLICSGPAYSTLTLGAQKCGGKLKQDEMFSWENMKPMALG